MIKICKFCKKEFKVRLYRKNIAKFCSYDCVNKSKTTKVKRKCTNCGKIILCKKGRSDGNRYCSNKCKYINTGKQLKGIPRKAEHRKKMSSAIKNQFKNGRKAWNKGTIGLLKGRKGKKCNFWKGGKSNLWLKLVNSTEYKKWEQLVYKRDNFTCMACGNLGRLEAHHIKAKSEIVNKFLAKHPYLKNKEDKYEAIIHHCKELWDIKNGTTLCIDCHKNTDNYCGRKMEKKLPNLS